MIEGIAFLLFLLIIYALIKCTYTNIKKGVDLIKNGYVEEEDWDNRDQMFVHNNDDFEDF